MKNVCKITDKDYYAFGCFSLSKESTYSGLQPINNIGASKDGQDAWYNHSIFRPVAYHFCAAITTNNIIKLNGFDERFSYGIGYEDNYFLDQVKLFGLNIKIIDNPFVCHQWHYDFETQNKDSLVRKNRELYKILPKQIKAKHIITQDL